MTRGGKGGDGGGAGRARRQRQRQRQIIAAKGCRTEGQAQLQGKTRSLTMVVLGEAFPDQASVWAFRSPTLGECF